MTIGIAEGTTYRATMDVGRYRVSEIRFPRGRHLPWHRHPRGCVAVVLDGVVGKRFRNRIEDAKTGTVIAMPPEEPHEDVFGRDGARIIVVEADHDIDSVACFRDWNAMLISIRIASELSSSDPFTTIAVEGLALELIGVASRGHAPPTPSAWLKEAEAQLRDQFRNPPSAAALATQLGVHSRHLARAFRAHYGETLGGYVRRLRLEWAAQQLATTDVQLACLAVEAGFADQSHFTHAFKRQFGLAPGRYRASLR